MIGKQIITIPHEIFFTIERGLEKTLHNPAVTKNTQTIKSIQRFASASVIIFREMKFRTTDMN